MNYRDALRGDLELFFQRLGGLTGSEGLNAFADADLSWSQVRVTALLACAQELPIGAVSEKLAVSIHSAGRTVDQLVGSGIVQRRECPTDRRVKLVSLTDHGRDLIGQHLTDRRRALDLFLERLPADRVEALAKAIRPILAGDYLDPRSATEQPTASAEPPGDEPPGNEPAPRGAVPAATS